MTQFKRHVSALEDAPGKCLTRIQKQCILSINPMAHFRSRGYRMKIGIVTIVDPTPNYGNKLQNYAVEQIFAGMGWQSVTLAPCRQNRTIPLALKYAARWCLGVVGVHSFSPEIRALYRRMFAFRRFDQTHLHIREDLCRGTVRPEQYDYFSIGSDQVWNPEQFWAGRISICSASQSRNRKSASVPALA